MSNSIKDSAQAFAVNQVLKYVDSNPQEAFPKLLDWADKFDKDNLYLTQRQQIRSQRSCEKAEGSNLRKKLKSSETASEHIKSIRGIGYKFEV